MIYVLSDLHGASDDMRKAVPEGAILILLGDLINFLDYTTMTGILCEVFSPEPVRRVADLRAEGKLHEARRLIRERSAGREDEVRRLIGEKVVQQYQDVFEAMPDPTYLILGNVDRPELAASYAGQNPGVHLVDGQVHELEGERFGFVGGALPTELNVGGEVTPGEMRSKLEGLGEVDVLCTHIPPSVPELCYDTMARHPEQGSEDILGYIRDVRPRLHYFGHVHQPLISSMYIGRTLCINVGYFRATRRAWTHTSPRVPE